jgi:hypothetical protein
LPSVARSDGACRRRGAPCTTAGPRLQYRSRAAASGGSCRRRGPRRRR